MLWMIIGFIVLGYVAEKYNLWNMIQSIAVVFLWPIFLIKLIFKL